MCLIGPGNIVGDMTVLANVRKRTASILCLTDLVTYKIRRATFIRRVPPMQLEVRACVCVCVLEKKTMCVCVCVCVCVCATRKALRKDSVCNAAQRRFRDVT